jgi:hypothetical protein
MKNLALAGLLIAWLLPATAAAQSAFDGTWKIDMKTAQYSSKPEVFVLNDGVYECSSCVPPVKVKADGIDHKVAGHPYYDSVAVKIISDRSVEEINKKDGKVVTTSTVVVSADGKTATGEFTDSSDSSAAPVTGKGVMTRAAAGPAGSHAISGSWVMSKMDAMSDNALILSLKLESDGLHMTEPTGQSYVAKLDGTDASYQGDPGINTVSVKRVDKNTFEETDKRDGKAIFVSRMTVSADGKSLTMVNHDLERDETARFTAAKQ